MLMIQCHPSFGTSINAEVRQELASRFARDFDAIRN